MVSGHREGLGSLEPVSREGLRRWKSSENGFDLSLSWDSPFSSWQTFVWMPSLCPLPSSHPPFLLPLSFTRSDMLRSVCCSHYVVVFPPLWHYLHGCPAQLEGGSTLMRTVGFGCWLFLSFRLGLCDPRSVLVSSGSYKMGEGPRLRWG